MVPFGPSEQITFRPTGTSVVCDRKRIHLSPRSVTSLWNFHSRFVCFLVRGGPVYAECLSCCPALYMSASRDVLANSVLGLSNSTSTPPSKTATLSNLSMYRSRWMTARTVWAEKWLSTTSCITDSVKASTLRFGLAEAHDHAGAGLN